MSKLGCPCGYVISDIAFPCRNKDRVITDSALDSAMHYTRSIIDLDTFEACEREMFTCPSCHGLLLEDGPGKGTFIYYRRDPDSRSPVLEGHEGECFTRVLR